MGNPVLARDGGALIVAMDHARTFGAIEGLEDPGTVIEAVVEGEADGVMTTFGVAKRYPALDDIRILKGEANDALDGDDVVPGWGLPVAELFA